MIALLLNSGRGVRMGAETKEHPKCMCRIDEQGTIISWQVKLLAQVGIREAVVTTGHYVPNPDYADTNYIVSMDNARHLLMDDDVISLHGDLVMHPGVMEMLAAASVSCGAVDASLPLPEKDFKARLQDGRISAIGVDVFGEDCVAFQPAYRFLKKDFRRWMEEIRRFVEAGERKCYAENAFNAVWQEIELYPLDVQGLLCAEIDNMEDHARVTAQFRETVRNQA